MEKNLTFIHTADLHQGFNFSFAKWKKGMKQRSDDFLNNFLTIINRSLESDVDFLVIAGDIFDRSKPPPAIRQIIIDNLVKVSTLKPVILIPGNHDKSKFNQGLLFIHKNLKIFNSPKTETFTIRKTKISITAMPFIKNKKLETINQSISNPQPKNVDFSLLVLHELVESCKVGIQNFQFTKFMKNVIPVEMIDNRFNYIALGHVHKYQRITISQTPILYSGSIERTSVVEREEEKGYLEVKVQINPEIGSVIINPTFIPLPAREMVYFKIPSLKLQILENFYSKIQDKIQSTSILPLVIIKINDLDDYAKYKSLKNFLSQLVEQAKIFDFSVTNPSFYYKNHR